MNLSIRGIDFNLGREPGDAFARNQHPDLRADFILANSPFNISDWWDGSWKAPRGVYGVPPKGNATANHAQARTLAAVRDAVRPRLMSGQLRMPEFEKVPQAA